MPRRCERFGKNETMTYYPKAFLFHIVATYTREPITVGMQHDLELVMILTPTSSQTNKIHVIGCVNNRHMYYFLHLTFEAWCAAAMSRAVYYIYEP